MTTFSVPVQRPPELGQFGRVKAGQRRVRDAGSGKRLGKAVHLGQKIRVQRAVVGNGDKQGVEQRGIRAGGDGKMQDPHDHRLRVRRGSITTTFISGRAALAATRRW